MRAIFLLFVLLVSPLFSSEEKVELYSKVQTLIQYNSKTLEKLHGSQQIDPSLYEERKSEILVHQYKVEEDLQSNEWKKELKADLKYEFKITRELDEILFEILDKSLDSQPEDVKNERYQEKLDYLLAASLPDKLKDDMLGQTPLHYGALLGDLKAIERAKSLLTDEEARRESFNHLNEDERSALDVALDKRHFDYAQKLIEEDSNVNLTNRQNETSLHIAIRNGSTESVAFLLKQTEIDLLAKDAYGNTPLHFAAEKDQPEILHLILQHEEGKKNINIENCFGLTPSQVQALKPPPIGQEHLIEKMLQYLKLKYRDESIVEKQGLCNGFAFLAQYYGSLGQEDVFFDALEAISKWDGQEDLDPLFDEWLNAINWFQQSFTKLEGYGNFEHPPARNRIRQFNLVKPKGDERDIVFLQAPLTYYGLSCEQLEELLTIWSHYPGTVLEFGGRGHATSGRVLEDGRISYYDPNIKRKFKTFHSLKELAKTIQLTKYKLLNYPEEMILDVMAYQYVTKGEKPLIPVLKEEKRNWKVGNASPNGFTPLHLALYANDSDAFRSLLQQSQTDPNEVNCPADNEDYMGITPLTLAILMGRHDFVDELLRHPKIDILKRSAGITPILSAIGHLNVDATALLLTHGIDLFKSDNHQLELNSDAIHALEVIYIPAVALCMMKQPEEMAFIQELLRRLPSLNARQDSKGSTLLDYATRFKNQQLVEMLTDKG